MPVTSEALQRQHELDTALSGVVDQQTRALVRAWATGWDEVAGDLRDTIASIAADTAADQRIPKAMFARSARLQMVLAYIGDRLTSLAADAGVTITRDIHQVVTDAAAAQASIISAMLPAGPRHAALAPHRIVPSALDVIVARTTEQITSELKPLQPAAEAAVRRELIRGVAAGIGPRDVADRMVARARDGFNGGLDRALVISRTEVLEAHRQAAQYAQRQHSDVLAGWIWLAHLSPTMCRACLAMNGSLHPLTEAGPQGHPNCRCARMPETKSWTALGIRGVEEPAGNVTDSESYFKTLTVAQQQQILGLRGYALWRRGEFPMSDWAKLQKNPGWRDAYVPAAPPKR